MAGNDQVDQDAIAAQWEASLDSEDPAQATAFMRTQISKHLEHYFASKGKPALAAKLSTEDQFPSITISPSRISELAKSPKRRAQGRRP